MKTLHVLVAAGFVSLTTTLAPAAEPATAPSSAITFPDGKDSVQVPLARAREQLCAKVAIDGQNAGQYILDTGASRGMVDPNFANKNNLPLLGSANVLGTSGSAKIRLRQAKSLEVAGVSFAAPALLEQDLAKTVFALDHIPMKGILGFDLLSQLPFTIDFQSATLTLHRTSTFTPPKDAQPFPLEILLDCPAVLTRINDHAEGYFLIDTGAPTVDLTALGTRLVPEVERQSGSSLVISTGIGGMDVLINSPIDIKFLNHSARLTARFPLHKPVAGNDSKQLGRLGYDCFINSRLTIDAPHSKLYIEWLPPLTVEAWLKAAGDPKKPDLLGSTVLTRAAKENRLDVCKALIEQGVNVAATDQYGGTALFQAAQNGNLELVQLLLDHKAPPDVVTAANAAATLATPLQIAAENGHAKIVAILLKAGANPNGKDPFGRTPLQQAAMAGHTDCVKLLLEAGANPNQKIPNLNLTPLHCAAIFGHADVIEALLAGKADPAAKDNEGNTPLHLCGFNKRPLAAAALIKAKSPLDACNNNNQTPLMTAAALGSHDIVDQLLKAGASPTLKDRANKSPLDYANDFGDPKTIQLITNALTPPTTQPSTQP